MSIYALLMLFFGVRTFLQGIPHYGAFGDEHYGEEDEEYEEGDFHRPYCETGG